MTLGLFLGREWDAEPDTAITPLQIVRDKVAMIGPRSGQMKIFFTKKKLAVPDDTKAAVKRVAQAQVPPSKEVLTSSGTGEATNSPSTAPAKTEAPAAPPPAAAPGCLSDATIRASVDAFLNGDDLDKKTRQKQVYANWPDINCYVLPIAEGSNAGVTPLQQSRALKLLINAIINNSQITDDPAYWQADGPNKRDFHKSLPYLQDQDLERIFQLIASEDSVIRAEALRFVKLLPVDGFEHLFKQKLQRLRADTKSESKAKTERFAVAGVSLYYIRIVEWLNGAADPTTHAEVAADFTAGLEWASDSYFDRRSAKPYEATLLYAKGIVERELKLTDDGNQAYKTSFASPRTR